MGYYDLSAILSTLVQLQKYIPEKYMWQLFLPCGKLKSMWKMCNCNVEKSEVLDIICQKTLALCYFLMLRH